MPPFILFLVILVTFVTQLLASHLDFNHDQWAYLSRVRLMIPRIEIIAPITRFPLGTETWEIDPWETRVGHFSGTAWLYTPGNMVIGGHAEYPDGSPAIFASLRELRPQDTVMLRFGELAYRYRVIETRYVEQNDLSVLYPSNEERLTLITCDEASYDPVSKTYGKRLVIIAVRIVSDE